MLEIQIAPEGNRSAANIPERLRKGSGVIDFPEEYICIDVETTGLDPVSDEIIEVAALHVRGGEVCGRFSSLVRPLRSHAVLPFGAIPKMGYDDFAGVPQDFSDDYYRENLISDSVEQLTGITNGMLRNAPSGDTVIPQFYDFIGNHLLVGHNVNFDINFLYDSCRRCGLILENNYVDTMRLSRKLLPRLKRHRLSDLAAHLGIEQDTAHRAESDAFTTVKCLEAMKSLVLETQTVPDFVNRFPTSTRADSARQLGRIQEQKHFRPCDLISPDAADPSHPLCGKCVVFTGELGISRRDAAQMAANVGAVVKTDVSRKTDFLVVGQQDLSLVGSSGISVKEKKARELNNSGKGNIQLLSEQEFVKLANAQKEAGAR